MSDSFKVTNLSNKEVRFTIKNQLLDQFGLYSKQNFVMCTSELLIIILDFIFGSNFLLNSCSYSGCWRIFDYESLGEHMFMYMVPFSCILNGEIIFLLTNIID